MAGGEELLLSRHMGTQAGAAMHEHEPHGTGTASVEDPESISTITSCGGVPSDTKMYDSSAATYNGVWTDIAVAVVNAC